MKQISLGLVAIALGLFVTGCGSSRQNGQLVGAPGNKSYYQAPNPIGMVYIPSGVLKSGHSDQNMAHSMDAPIRTFNMQGFYMDATEITNSEYRQFTNWVRDSIAHTLLGDFKDNEDGSQSLDWSKEIRWQDEDVQDQLLSMYIPAMQSPTGKKKLNTKMLNYTYKYFDYDEAIQHPGEKAGSFFVTKTINCYPDTTVWAKQFNYSNNDPMSRLYNWLPAFDDYPVVGVNWNQSNAFCAWRTQLWKSARNSRGQFMEGHFSLPTEQQWEWAARGGRELSPYPWGGPYILNKKGCYLANFKPGRGDYSADGGLYTVRADAYWPNDYGLYNMSGNVAEWTLTSYFAEAYNRNIYSDMNPAMKVKIKENAPKWQKRKVVKGGSWRDTYEYLDISNRDYEFADNGQAYIGFRCVYIELYPSVTNNPNQR